MGLTHLEQDNTVHPKDSLPELTSATSTVDDFFKGTKGCRASRNRYESGQTMYLPVPHQNVADAKFKMCECRDGRAVDCRVAYCESGYMGVLDCKQASVLRGDHCPSCSEYQQPLLQKFVLEICVQGGKRDARRMLQSLVPF